MDIYKVHLFVLFRRAYIICPLLLDDLFRMYAAILRNGCKYLTFY